MTSPDWQRVRELFEQALEQDLRDPSAWLEAAEPDSAVRAEVRSLLEHHARAGSFLGSPVAEQAPGLLDDVRLSPGRVVGSYTIVRELGSGAMGHVYLARDDRLGREVALKAISPSLGVGRSERERLRREARLAAQLTHPGICTVYALEEVDGELYIASEYIEGRTLREEIAGGSVRPAVQVLQVAQEIASALGSAHARGIVHRDLKPENIMRTAEGRVKILDFGLARLEPAREAPDAGGVTLPGVLVGTPAYMSPEQLNAQPADPRSDVFGFGVIVYEYASRRHPFAAATPLAQAARMLEGEAAPIAAHRPDLEPALAATIDRCLRKPPSERFATALDIVAALARREEPPRWPVGVWWWRVHQAVVVGLYLLASVVAWQVKEWRPGLADLLFIAIGFLAAVGGVFRGHLAFTEKTNGRGLEAERARAAPVTLTVDVLIAVGLAVDGLLLAADEPLRTVLIGGLAVGIALARMLLEPSTTQTAFGGPR